MTCPLCSSRPAKRRCPALGRSICAVCCGTKRQVEIQCPAECGYLTTARQHPPAIVQRQHERDVSLLMPAMAGLTERQSRFFFLFQSIVARHRTDPLRPLLDQDIAEAAASQATSLGTAARGLIYEQAPQALNAQELSAAFRQAFDEIAQQIQGPRTPLEHDAAKALRGIEEAARKVGPILGEERTGYLELIRRVLKPAAHETPPPSDLPQTAPGSSIILP